MLVTLPIPILLALLAQAEPEPVGTMPKPATEAGPAPVAESAAGAEPAPAAKPTPGLPPATKPEQGQEPPPEAEPHMALGFRAGADFQLSGDVSPKVGYSFSPFFQYDYARLANRLALGLRTEFTFDRFQKQVAAQAGVNGGPLLLTQATRTLTFFDFALLATATFHLHLLQPWVAAGAGLTLAHFLSPETAFEPGESRTTRPLVLGACGLDVAIGRGALVGLHVEYRSMLVGPRFLLDSGKSIQVFGDRVSVAAALLYQF